MNSAIVGLSMAMEREGVAVERVAAIIGRKPATVARWIDGEGRGFTLSHAATIQRELFPNDTLEDLFNA